MRRVETIHEIEGRDFDWYVVQVQAGREMAMCSVIERACSEHDERAAPDERIGLRECFSPKFHSQKKWRGEWREVDYQLMPGYVVAIVKEPSKLDRRLRDIRDFCRVVTSGETYMPLSEYERTWIASYTSKGNRVVPMSFGYREGDSVVVTQGPLKGNEARIVKVDRTNSMAHLEFHVGQMTIKTKVGLAVMPQRR